MVGNLQPVTLSITARLFGVRVYSTGIVVNNSKFNSLYHRMHSAVLEVSVLYGGSISAQKQTETR